MVKVADGITLRVSDVSGQRNVVVRDIPRDASWGQTMQAVLGRMSLPRNPEVETIWKGRLEREGRHIHASEIVGEALQNEDHVVLHPEVQAG